MKKYGETESDIWAKDSSKCREIVSEIMNFGIPNPDTTGNKLAFYGTRK